MSTLGIEYLIKHLNDLVANHRQFSRVRAPGEAPYPRISPSVLGVVFLMVPKRLDQPTQSVRPFVEEIKQLPDVPVFDTIIRRSTGLFAPAPRDGVPVSVKTSVQAEVAKELDDLATEFIAKTGLKGSQV